MSNKHNFGTQNIFNGGAKFDNIFIGKVVDTTDKFDGNRIKVRIKGVDDKISDSDLTYAFPLLPKFIGLVPSVGESVFIFLLKNDNNLDNRMYVGPIISQPQKLKYDPHYYSSTSLLTYGAIAPDKSPSLIPDANGVYPKKEYFSLQGRDNTDIIFKEREIVIRAGKFETNDNLKFNKKNIGYIQIKHDAIIDYEKKSKGTVTNIVSDKINLLSHNGSPRFILDNQDNLITDEELSNIMKNAHPLVFGDLLVQLINLFKNFVTGHSHPYHGLPPVKDQNVNDITKFNLNSILSNNIKIN